MARPRTVLVLVPADLALVCDANGWRFADDGEVPPAWWLELTEPEIADEPGMLAATPPAQRRVV
jgi:hypothetical protein